jgi:hypothetical protein
MINGKFDFFFPTETSQKPFYDLLGTPEEHKRYVVCTGSHAVPRRELIKEILARSTATKKGDCRRNSKNYGGCPLFHPSEPSSVK